METANEWLHHLQNAIPKEVYGYAASMYSIALEGWRRGLTVRYINKNRTKAQTEFVISSDTKRFRFSSTRANIIPKETIRMCLNKHETKELLKENGVPVLDGQLFTEKMPDEQIIHFVEDFGYPIVVKPYNGHSGDGVVINITSEQKLKDALTYVRKELKHSNILIERYIPSADCQVYVIEDEVVAAFERVPAHIVGDGEHTIETLIKEKNKQRRKNPGLYRYLIDKHDVELEYNLELKGYSLDTVLEQGEKVYFKAKANVSDGGDPVDVTDKLTNKMKEVAIKAIQAIPNLPLGAVEMIVDRTTGQAYVLEIKTQPTITGHLFPTKGKARDVAKKIIDFYFPETKARHESPYYYFYFDYIYKFFNTNHIQEYVLPSAPTGKLTSKRYIISGLTHRMKFINWVKPHIITSDLNGFFRYQEEGRLELVLAGTEDSISEIVGVIDKDLTFKKEDFQITEEEYHQPIAIGFEVHTLKENPGKKKRHRSKKKKRRKEVNLKQKNKSKPLGGFLDSIKKIAIK